MDRIRSRMEAELSRESEGERYDFKVGRGGLADIDFLMQMIQIREGKSREGFRISGTRDLLPALAEARSAVSTGLLSQKEAQTLHDSYCFLRRLEGFARMESDSNVNWISSSAEALVSLGRRMEMRSPEGQSLLHHYRESTGRVRRIYSRVVKRLRML
jgi:glutamate-ammonia-ligase adenylyltransferase